MGPVRDKATRQQVEAERINAQTDWGMLLGNDPNRTRIAVDTALRKAGIPAAVNRVESSSTSLVVVCEVLADWIAEIEPAMTPAGRATTRKRSKTQRNALYLAAIASNVLSAAQTTLGAAPGTSSVTCIAVQRAASDELKGSKYIPVYFGTFTRKTINDYQAAGLWTDDPGDLEGMLRIADDVTLIEKGRSKDLQPIDAD